MATNPFRGYLIKSPRIYQMMIATTTQTEAERLSHFPLQYIQWDSPENTPNQREELKAYRDDNTRNLTRVTASGKKSTMLFKLRRLNLKEKMEVQAWLGNAQEDTQEAHEQRKVYLEYWDDEENTYKTGYFYRPNATFKILHIDEKNKDIIYKEQELKFVEY